MKRKNVTPYLLVLPTLLYLGFFFAYPMFNALQLAFQDDIKYLDLRAEPDLQASTTGTLAMLTVVDIINREQKDELLPNGRTRPIWWFEVEASDVEGERVTGWGRRGDIEVENAQNSLEGRVQNGTPIIQWSLDNIRRMTNDSRFIPAIRNTILLIVLILPIQFVLAIVMALVLQADIKGGTFFLYIYAIPLGISDLAAGLVWYAFFTQRGFINSFLNQVGLQDSPFVFISAGNYGWLVTAIVIAEVWRATSIVMVIVVSGLQAIPRDYLEAGEVFGANLWQRVWHIVLPMLKPSLQVALILRTILAFQVFAVVVAITGGEVFTVLANETYRWYQRGDTGFNNPNVAAAYAGLIMFISLGIAFFYLRAVRTQEEAMKR